MAINRRTFAAALGAAMLPCVGRAEELIIVPDTHNVRSGTRYAKFSNPGPYGRPKSPVEITLEGNLKLFLWLPPGLRNPSPVVFSHAELSVPLLYDNLLGHWASHGFAVLAPLHDDSVLEKGLAAQTMDVKGVHWDLTSLIGNPEAWTARAKTCRACLDSFPVLERSSGLVLGDTRPVISGHSFGSYVAQLLTGTRAVASAGKILTEIDPRFVASMLLSPQGRGVLGLVDGSWDGMTLPSVVVTGNGDEDATGQDPAKKIESFQLAPPGNKHLAWFSSISPTVYSGQQVAPGSANSRIFQDLLAVSTAFLTAYGKYDPEVFAELAGDYYTRMTAGRVSMQYR